MAHNITDDGVSCAGCGYFAPIAQHEPRRSKLIQLAGFRLVPSIGWVCHDCTKALVYPDLVAYIEREP